jgi:hypothetical protein
VYSAPVDLAGEAHVDEIAEQVQRDRRAQGLVGGPSIKIMVVTALHHQRSEGDVAPLGGVAGNRDECGVEFLQALRFADEQAQSALPQGWRRDRSSFLGKSRVAPDLRSSYLDRSNGMILGRMAGSV